MTIQKVNETNFKQVVIASSIPVLVDFHSADCPSCTPDELLEELASGYTGRVAFARADTDAENTEKILLEYEVRGIPTLILFHKGEPVSRFLMPLEEGGLARWLEKSLAELEKAQPSPAPVPP